MKVYLFLAEGFEEIEAIAPIDIFRRAGIETITVSITSDKIVTGAHGISVVADALFESTDFSGEYLLFLPGGMPGTLNLSEHEGLLALIATHAGKGKLIAAICAAPSVLGKLNLLEGKEAICYPGYESEMLNAKLSSSDTVKSGTVYTAKAAGVAMKFAINIVEELKGKEMADKVSASMFLA